MRLIGRIELPAHKGPGGFDHAAVHGGVGRLFVAHTSNDAVDVVDCVNDRYLFSIPGLAGVAGTLVSEELGLIFTSNRGDDTVGIIREDDLNHVTKVKVGVRPNGLSVDARRGLLLAANVGNPEIPGSHTLSVVDVQRLELIHSIPVAGRTRWAIFDPSSDSFYVNIADPFEIAVVAGGNPTRVARSAAIPAPGPHGLDLDPANGRLLCACDEGKLFAVDAESGSVLAQAELSGAPDVIFLNASRRHLYVAVGDPGVMDVIDADTLRRLETVETAKGAHTLGFDARRNKLYVFEPGTHEATIYGDEPAEEH
ncbi:MAG TPA: YncE family protein [Anaerolineales bacterium]